MSTEEPEIVDARTEDGRFDKGNTQSKKPSRRWFNKGLTQSERGRLQKMSRSLELAGFGNRAVCDARALRYIQATRYVSWLASLDLDVFHAEQEKAWRWFDLVEETCRIASGLPKQQRRKRNTDARHEDHDPFMAPGSRGEEHEVTRPVAGASRQADPAAEAVAA